METTTAVTTTMPKPLDFIIIDEVSANSETQRNQFQGEVGIVLEAQESGIGWRRDADGEYHFSLGPVLTVIPAIDPSRQLTISRWHEPSPEWLANDSGDLLYMHKELLRLYAKSKLDYTRLDSQFSKTLEVQTRHLHFIADEKDFCSEFDEFVERMNNECPGPYYIEQRMRDYRVTVRRERTILEETEVTVTASYNSDEDDLYDIAVEVAEDYDNWCEIDENTGDYDIMDYTAI